MIRSTVPLLSQDMTFKIAAPRSTAIASCGRCVDPDHKQICGNQQTHVSAIVASPNERHEFQGSARKGWPHFPFRPIVDVW